MDMLPPGALQGAELNGCHVCVRVRVIQGMVLAAAQQLQGCTTAPLQWHTTITISGAQATAWQQLAAGTAVRHTLPHSAAHRAYERK